MSFEFSEKGQAMETAVSMSQRMHLMSEENIPQIMRSRYVAEQFDPKVIKEYSSQLTRADNVIIFLKSKSFAKDKNIKLKEERWYKTKYNVEPFAEKLTKLMKGPKSDVSVKKLDLPPKNTLIPEDLDILTEGKA